MKTTLHGVKSSSTKAMFSDLKKRGFSVTLESGSNDTFKILAFINGVEYVISCVDGAEPTYTKGYSRNKWKWLPFQCVDDLLLASMVKKESKPTDKQSSYLSTLIECISSITTGKVKVKIPRNVVDMSSAIKQASCVKNEVSGNPDYRVLGHYVTIS